MSDTDVDNWDIYNCKKG